MSGREPFREHNQPRIRSRPHDCGPARYVERERRESSIDE